MSDDLRNGWAVRRADQCNSTESGKWTWGKWVYCCPKGMEAHTDLDDNKQCRIGSPPDDFPNQCADSTLVLWKDSKGYFCCEVDLIGFINENSWKGCVDTDEFNEGQKNDTMTRADQLGQPTVTMTSTSTSSATSQASATTTTSAPSSTLDSSKSQDSSSSTNIGAIAGGVVGGFFGALLIVGVIWFFNRRRRSAAAAAKSNSENTAFNAAGQPPVPGNFVAVPGNNSSSWTGSYSNTISTQQELPGNMPAPHELAGNRSESKP